MRDFKWYLGWTMIAASIWLSCATAFGATITVSPGQSISAAITGAAAGDTIQLNAGTFMGGFNITKSVSVVANGAVIVKATTARSGTALVISANDCSVTGVIFEDFGWGLSTSNTPRNRVTLKNTIFRRSGSVWIIGDSWLMEGCTIERPAVNGQPAGDADYCGLYGTNHVLRRNFFHGLNLNTDLPAGAHTDSIQTFTLGGLSWQVLQNVLIEENIFADTTQGFHISDDNNSTARPIKNLTIRNNVFWGRDFIYNGENVSTAHGTLFQNHIPGVTLTNNIYRGQWHAVSLYSMDDIAVEGNIFYDLGNPYARAAADGGSVTPATAIKRGTKGNVFWQVSTDFILSPLAPDRILDPQLRNPAANSGLEVCGADGKPFTLDDAWVPLNATVASYGPQLSGTTPPPPPPPADTVPPVITLLGANPLNLTVGQNFTDPGATALDAVSGVVAVTPSGTVNTAVAGAYTRTYTAKDAANNTATATRTVNVTAVVPPPTLTLEQRVKALEDRLGSFPDTSRVRNNQTSSNVYVPSRKTVTP